VVATGLGGERGRRPFASTGTGPDLLEPPSFLEDLS
jgi:hypothetical protein